MGTLTLHPPPFLPPQAFLSTRYASINALQAALRPLQATRPALAFLMEHVVHCRLWGGSGGGGSTSENGSGGGAAAVTGRPDYLPCLRAVPVLVQLYFSAGAARLKSLGTSDNCPESSAIFCSRLYVAMRRGLVPPTIHCTQSLTDFCLHSSIPSSGNKLSTRLHVASPLLGACHPTT